MLCGANLCGPLFLTGDETVDERKEAFMGPCTVLSNSDWLEYQYLAKMLERGYAVLEAFRCEKDLATKTIHLLYRLALLFTTPLDGIISRAEKKKIAVVGCPLFEELEETLHSALKYFERFTDEDFREHLLVGTHPQTVFASFESDITDLAEKLKETFKIKPAFSNLLESSSTSSSSKYGQEASTGDGQNSSPGGGKQQFSRLPVFQCDFRDSATQAAESNSMMDKLLAKRRFTTAREVESFVKNMKDVAEYVNEAMEATTKLVGGMGGFSIIRQSGLRQFWQEKFNRECCVSLASFCEGLKGQLIAEPLKMTPASAQSLVNECNKGPFRFMETDEMGQVDVIEVTKLFDVLPRNLTNLKLVLTSLVDYCEKGAIESLWVKKMLTQKSEPATKKEVYQKKKTKEIRRERPAPDGLVRRLLPAPRATVSMQTPSSAMTSSVPSSRLLPLPSLLPPLVPPHLDDAREQSARPLHIFWNASQEKLLTSALSNVGWLIVTGPRMTGKTCRLLAVLQNEEDDTSSKGAKSMKLDVAPAAGTTGLAKRDKIYVDFRGVTSDSEGRSRLVTQLSLKHTMDGDSVLAAFKELLFSLRPNSVVVLDNFDSLIGFSSPLQKPGKSKSIKSTKIPDTPQQIQGSEAVAGATATPGSAANSFSDEILDALRPWQATFCIILVVHSEPVRSSEESKSLKQQLPKTKDKKNNGSEDDEKEARGHDQFQIHSYIEAVFSRLPQKRKFVVPPLSYKPAMALARSLQPVDSEALVLAGRYLPAEMVFLHRFCSLKTIRSIAAMRTKEDRDAAGGTGGAGAASASGPGEASAAKPKDSNNGPGFAHSLAPGASVRRLWDAATNLILKDMLAHMSPDERLAASAIIPGTPPFGEGCAWALCREVFSGDLLRWRLAFRGLVRCGWLLQMGDFGLVTMAPLGYVVPPPIPNTASAPSTGGGGNSGEVPPSGEPKAARVKPPPPPRKDAGQAVTATPTGGGVGGAAAAGAMPLLSQVSIFERRGSLYLHYWASELTRIDLLSGENSINASLFDHGMAHFRIMLASLVAATSGLDMRSGGKLQGAVTASTDRDGIGIASSKSSPRMLSFGRSLSPSFTLQGNIEKRDESELEIPLFFVPDPSTLGIRLAGHLSRVLARLPSNEAVLAARAVLHHIVEATPQKDSYEYLTAGTDLGEQLRRAGCSLEGCSLMKLIVRKFPIEDVSNVEAQSGGLGGDQLNSLVARGASSQQRSSVARALFVYSSLLQATSRQTEALEHSKKAIELWQSCASTPDIRQRLLLASSREMVLLNASSAPTTSQGCSGSSCTIA